MVDNTHFVCSEERDTSCMLLTVSLNVYIERCLRTRVLQFCVGKQSWPRSPDTQGKMPNPALLPNAKPGFIPLILQHSNPLSSPPIILLPLSLLPFPSMEWKEKEQRWRQLLKARCPQLICCLRPHEEIDCFNWLHGWASPVWKITPLKNIVTQIFPVSWKHCKVLWSILEGIWW